MRTKGSKNHGLSKTPFYQTWVNMRSRCFYKKDKKYKYYGGKGITVCSEWLDFMNFKNDMYDSHLAHKKEHTSTTIERIDNNGNYCLDNCCWKTMEEQHINTQFSKNSSLKNAKLITILITDKQHELLKARAKEKEIRMSEQIRRAIDRYFQRLGEKII